MKTCKECRFFLKDHKKISIGAAGLYGSIDFTNDMCSALPEMTIVYSGRPACGLFDEANS